MRWFFLALLLIGGMAQSQPAPKPVPPVAGKAETSNSGKENPGNQQSISINFPSTINVSVAGKLDVKSKQEKDNGQEEPTNWAEWSIALFTLGLVIATVWLVAVTRGLLNEAKKQFPHFKANVQAATDAANAALIQAQTSQREFVATHRPRVILRAAYFDDSPNVGLMNIPVKFVFVNIGETEARITAWDRDLAEGGEGFFPVPFIYEDTPKPISYTLNSGGQLILEFETGFTAVNRAMIERKGPRTSYNYFIHGRVIYDDRHGTRRETGFCRKWNGKTFAKLEGAQYTEYEYED